MRSSGYAGRSSRRERTGAGKSRGARRVRSALLTWGHGWDGRRVVPGPQILRIGRETGAEQERGHLAVALQRMGQVVDPGKRLILTGRFHDERAVMQYSAPQGLLEGQVGHLDRKSTRLNSSHVRT